MSALVQDWECPACGKHYEPGYKQCPDKKCGAVRSMEGMPTGWTGEYHNYHSPDIATAVSIVHLAAELEKKDLSTRGKRLARRWLY